MSAPKIVPWVDTSITEHADCEKPRVASHACALKISYCEEGGLVFEHGSRTGSS